MFLHKTKVDGYKSPIVVHLKGNKCPRCKSVFASEKSANDHYRRNLRRRSCAKRRNLDVRAQEQRKKRRKKALHAANAFLDSRSREIEGKNAAWFIPADAQVVVAAVEEASSNCQSQNPGKGKPHPMGPRRVTFAAGLLSAFSDQPGQGETATTDHHREAGQTFGHREQAFDCQTEGHVGAIAQNVQDPRPASSGNCTVRVVQGQEI